MNSEIEILKLDKAVAELDARWYKRQDSFKIHDRGKDYIPSVEDAEMQLGFVILAFFGMVAFYLVSKITFTFAIIGAIMMLIYVFILCFIRQKAKYYEEEKAKYEKRRRDLLLEIQKLKN